MKKVISIILVLMLCLGCCFAFTACSKSEEDVRKESRQNARYIEIAKSSFSAVMESYNGWLTIKNERMDITAQTTIQEVVDFLSAKGANVTVDHLNTERPFLGACEELGSGYYTIKSDVEWLEYYI